jgi:exosortase
LATVSAILASGFFILHIAGLRALPALFGTWMLLWLIVPPPLGVDLLLISWMQSLTSRLSSLLLDLLCIDHLMAGNTLHLSGTTLFVNDACSGVHSLFALLGCTAVFAVMRRRTVRHGVMLLASSLGWAILLNLCRVTVIALARVQWEVDLATGWPHQMLGLVTFLSALGLMLSTDQWLLFVGYNISQMSNYRWRHRADTGRLRSVPSSSRAKEHLGTVRSLEQSLWKRMSPSRSIRCTAIIAYAVLLISSVSSWGHTGTASWTGLSLTHLSRDILPHSLGEWTQQDFNRIERTPTSPLGRHSLVWKYERDPSETPAASCLVSLDAPFSGWHELTHCYEGSGWRVDDRSILIDTDDQSGHWIKSRLSRSTGRHAVLVFGLMTVNGQLLAPPQGIDTARLVDRLQDKPTLQIQGFLESDEPIDEQLVDELRALVFSSAARCALVIRRQQGGSSDG